MNDLHALRASHQKMAGGREQAIDPVGLAHAGRLIERAESLPTGPRERLLVRAGEALARVRARAESAHRSAGERIDALEREGFEVTALRARLARGETLAVERAHRLRSVLGREVRRRDPALEARLASIARRAGVDAGPDLTPEALAAIAGRLYRKAAAEASTGLLIERALRNRPVDAGRYHTGSVAASILLALRDASPVYMRAQLARLELAAEIRRFVAAFEPLPEPKPAASRGGRSTRGASKATGSKRRKAPAESERDAASAGAPEVPARPTRAADAAAGAKSPPKKPSRAPSRGKRR